MTSPFDCRSLDRLSWRTLIVSCIQLLRSGHLVERPFDKPFPWQLHWENYLKIGQRSMETRQRLYTERMSKVQSTHRRYENTHTHTRVCTHTNTLTKNTQINTHLHSDTHTHRYIYIHTHVCARTFVRQKYIPVRQLAIQAVSHHLKILFLQNTLLLRLYSRITYSCRQEICWAAYTFDKHILIYVSL